MEFEGVVYKILPPTSGTSARGEWKRQDVVFELPQEFSRKICVTFFNKDSEVAQLHEGMACTVSVNVESREFNGRWYTSIRAWKIQQGVVEAAPAVQAVPAAQPVQAVAAPQANVASFDAAAGMDESSELPF